MEETKIIKRTMQDGRTIYIKTVKKKVTRPKGILTRKVLTDEQKLTCVQMLEEFEAGASKLSLARKYGMCTIKLNDILRKAQEWRKGDGGI